MRFLYFDSAFSKEKVVDLVPSDAIEYSDPIKAIKEGPAYVDGISFKTGLLLDGQDQPKMYYSWSEKKQRTIAQDFKESA